MKELVLLTGASSGIGLEMARVLAEKKFDLILVARRRERLEALRTELEAQYGIKAYTLPTDLAKPENAIALYQEITRQGLEVSILINNAGFGGYGEFAETPLDKELEMIDVNISSLVVLTKLFLQDMKKRNRGRILNMASILSFFPFPYYAVYAATKAFVLSFTEAIRTELEGANITVTALSPGPTDTEFNSEEMWQTNAYQGLNPIDPKVVAKKGVEYLLQGKGTKVIGLQNRFVVNTPRFSPRSLTLRINKFMASKAEGNSRFFKKDNDKPGITSY